MKRVEDGIGTLIFHTKDLFQIHIKQQDSTHSSTNEHKQTGLHTHQSVSFSVISQSFTILNCLVSFFQTFLFSGDIDTCMRFKIFLFKSLVVYSGNLKKLTCTLSASLVTSYNISCGQFMIKFEFSSQNVFYNEVKENSKEF